MNLEDFVNKKYDTYQNTVFYNNLADAVIEMIINDIDFDTVPGKTDKQFEKALLDGPFRNLYDTVFDYLSFCVSFEPEFVETVEKIKINAVNEYCSKYACPDMIPKWIGDPTRLIDRYSYIRNIESGVWDVAFRMR